MVGIVHDHCRSPSGAWAGFATGCSLKVRAGIFGKRQTRSLVPRQHKFRLVMSSPPLKASEFKIERLTAASKAAAEAGEKNRRERLEAQGDNHHGDGGNCRSSASNSYSVISLAPAGL
jgi:hypothetical protein